MTSGNGRGCSIRGVLKQAGIARDERVALHTSRREAAEQTSARAMRARLDDLMAMVKALRAEASAIERTVQASTDDPAAPAAQSLSMLRRKRVVPAASHDAARRHAHHDSTMFRMTFLMLG